jgi:hypothetical protein
MSEYEQQAQAFLTKHGIKFDVERSPHQTCPPFCEDQEHIHGGRYSVQFTAEGRTPLVLDFWNSHVDEHPEMYHSKTGQRLRIPEFNPHTRKYWERKQPIAPTPYSVLACVSTEIDCPETFSEFCSEYGYDTDSKKAEALFHRCNEFAWKLRRFFTDEEKEELQEIQ